MSETKFTKGPWILDYGMVVIGDINYELDNAYDAPLIAAAPEMYEMLSLMTYLVKLKYGNSDKEIHEKVLEAENLLAKARGEHE